MKNRSGEKIKLTSIDELLGVVNEESAMEIEISKIYAFKDHPFKVLDDEKMADLIESVKINGVLTPVLIRSDDEEGYEMISGHRRLHRSRVWGKRNPHQENSVISKFSSTCASVMITLWAFSTLLYLKTFFLCQQSVCNCPTFTTHNSLTYKVSL